MSGAAQDGLTPRRGRRPRGRQGKGEAPNPGRTSSSPSLPPLTFVKKGRYHCGKSRLPGKRRQVCLQPLPATSSHWGCGQPVRGSRPSQADPNHLPVQLRQCPLLFRLPPCPTAATLGTHGPGRPCAPLPKRRPWGLSSAHRPWELHQALPGCLSASPWPCSSPAFPAEPARHSQHPGPAGGGAAGERHGRE